MSDGKPRPATLLARGAEAGDHAFQALVPPLHPSTTYRRSADGSYPGGRAYTRDRNPTYEPAERLLAELEGGEEALLFSSGMAAATTLLEGLDAGAHLVAPQQMYWALRGWLLRLEERGRLEVDLVPAGDLAALERALRPGQTRLVWLETPANPTCEVTDLAAATELAAAAGARVAVDNTVATPLLTRPLTLGADYVVHSATKSLNGHSDVLAGALVTRRVDDLWRCVLVDRGARGALPGPFEAWLLLRGMRTLALRVEASCRNAQRVAAALAAHAGVAEVLYPGLATHPGHDVARRQMHGGFGAILSARIGGGETAARRLAGALRFFTQATSLGGVESLVEHRFSVEGAGSLSPPDLLRFSIGIEDPDDLVADLKQALDRL